MNDDKTIFSYNQNFDKYIEMTPHEISGEHLPKMEKFCERVGGEKKVFELGSAFLRDAKFMREKGLKVFCTDVIEKSLEMAKRENFENSYFDFRGEIKPEWENEFDAVLANAVLLHANKEEFIFALQNILKLLKVGGIFEFTLKKGVGEEMENKKIGGYRFFKYWQKDEVLEILKRVGFVLEDFKELEVGKWLCFTVRK